MASAGVAAVPGLLPDGGGGSGNTTAQKLIQPARWAIPAEPLRTIYRSQTLHGQLLQAVHSDIPGQVKINLTVPVLDKFGYDTVILPRDTLIIAVQEGRVTYGATRLALKLEQLELPSGEVIDLRATVGDDAGSNGMKGKVNNHYGKLILGTGLSALLNIGVKTAVGTPGQERVFPQSPPGRRAGRRASRAEGGHGHYRSGVAGAPDHHHSRRHVLYASACKRTCNSTACPWWHGRSVMASTTHLLICALLVSGCALQAEPEPPVVPIAPPPAPPVSDTMVVQSYPFDRVEVASSPAARSRPHPPTKGTRPLRPEEVILQAQKAARIEPSERGYVGQRGEQVYAWAPGKVYTVYLRRSRGPASSCRRASGW